MGKYFRYLHESNTIVSIVPAIKQTKLLYKNLAVLVYGVLIIELARTSSNVCQLKNNNKVI